MTFNRFDFLELGNKPQRNESNSVVDDSESPIRFDPPPMVVDQPISPASYRPSGGLEEEVRYASRSLKVVEVIGSRGTTAGAFNFPSGIAVDRSGILFVADAYNHRIQRITVDGGVSPIGGRGAGRMQFHTPIDIAVDEDRSFYVVEHGNHRAQKFSADGIWQFAIGREGNRPGEFRNPCGIAVARGSKDIYIADTGNHRVQRFDRYGSYIQSIGAAGGVNPPLTSVQAVAADDNGNVYVADRAGNRIVMYDPSGRFVYQVGRATDKSAGPAHFELDLIEPISVELDERGRLYVSDGGRVTSRLSAIKVGSNSQAVIVENVGRGLGNLGKPAGIAAAPVTASRNAPGCERGDIYVADTMNHRILRFVWS